MKASKDSKSAELASVGSTFAFCGLFCGPIFGIPAVIEGFKALKALTPVEKILGMKGPKQQALVAIIGGIFVSIAWPVAIIYFCWLFNS